MRGISDAVEIVVDSRAVIYESVCYPQPGSCVNFQLNPTWAVEADELISSRLSVQPLGEVLAKVSRQGDDGFPIQGEKILE